MRQTAVVAALAAAFIQFAAPAFATEYVINFGGKNPAPLLLDFDPITETFGPGPGIDWVSGGGEIFVFNEGVATPTPAPDCYTGPTMDASILNCLLATGATDPGITHTWTIAKGAGFDFLTNEVADLTLTITDAGGSLVADSGPTLGTGVCAFTVPGVFPPPAECGYSGATFTGAFTVAPIPEPTTVTLTALGLAGVVRRYRRRRAAR